MTIATARLCAWALLAALGTAPAVAQSADTILFNGKIVTLEGADAREALAVRDGKIARGRQLGRRSARSPAPPRASIDLGGRTVIPGPDRFPHARHPRRAELRDRGELDRRAFARRGAGPHPRTRPSAAKPGQWLIVAGGWTEQQFAEKRRPTQAEIAAAAPDHPVYVQLLLQRACCSRRRPSRRSISRATPTCRRAASSSATRAASRPAGSPATTDHHRPVRPAAAADLRAERRRHASVLPRAQPARPHRRERSRAAINLTAARLPAAVPGLARPRADRARELQPVRAAARQRARGIPGAHADAADGLRRRHAALQRHRRERHLGHVQQRQSRPRRRRSSIYEVAQWAADARHDADPALDNDRSVHHLLDVLERVNRETPIARLRWSIAHLNDASPREPRAHEGAGRRLADAERDVFQRRGVPQGARRGGRCGSRRRSRPRCKAGRADRRRHRRAPRDVLQSVRLAAMDARRQDRRRHARRAAPRRSRRASEALRLYTKGSAWFSLRRREARLARGRQARRSRGAVARTI